MNLHTVLRTYISQTLYITSELLAGIAQYISAPPQEPTVQDLWDQLIQKETEHQQYLDTDIDAYLDGNE
jgi:hypothetical protein